MKCEHGNYIPQGETKSPYCTGCNQEPLHIFPATRRRLDVIRPERVLDADEYFAQPVTDRLADAFNMENMSA